MKKIITFAAVLIFSLPLISCEGDKPEIFELVEMLLGSRQDGGIYSFSAEFTVGINREYFFVTDILSDLEEAELSAAPDKIHFRLEGQLHHVSGRRAADAVLNLYVEDYFSLPVFIVDDVLYFENNEVTRVILDLLTVTGFVHLPVNRVFSGIFYESRGIISVDLTDFDLSRFERYAERAGQIFVTDSRFDTSPQTGAALAAPAFPRENITDFADVIAQTQRALLRTPGYRHSHLHIVLCPDDNTMNILASRENGARTVLEPFDSDIDIAALIEKAREDSTNLWTESILPLRCILELMGREVGWNYSSRRPFITGGEGNIYFDADIINSRSYINLIQLLITARLSVRIVEIGYQLEFEIAAR